MRGLQGKGVLISGGSSGIGLAAARRMLEEGCRVFICGVDSGQVERALTELRPRGQVMGAACDISREDAVRGMLAAAEQALGAIDILLNNAGIAWTEPFLEMTPASWDRVLDVNLRGMFLVGQGVARRMVERGQGGAIVNMASTNGLVGEELYAHYNASKGGVVLLTKTMALELGRHNIRVNALCPGYIHTPLTTGIDDAEFAAAYARDKIALHRVGQAAEVAAAYAFLASDEASFITGTTLVVDGGQLAV
jgi:3-oxoacyl-[acyl-carrier protein] reductase